MARRVLLVVDYLCHVIVHFRCMYEMGIALAEQLHPAINTLEIRCSEGQYDLPRSRF
jgi:hypothetical protein